MEVLRRRGAGLEGRAAVAGTLEEEEHLGWVEERDPSRRREDRFAEREEDAAAQKR